MTLRISTVDTHTLGEPTRVVVDGLNPIPGPNMRAKKRWFAKHQDHIRRFLLWEPRGHQDMFGAVVLEPTTHEADIGLFFMDSGGYLDMCGHGSMGAVAALIHAGTIPVPVEKGASRKGIILDTPAGLIKTTAHIHDGRCTSVTIQNQPAFWHSSIQVIWKGKSIPVDIAYGGNFFGLVDEQAAGVSLEKNNLERLTKFGLWLRDELNKRVRVVHPLSQERSEVALIEVYREGQPAKNVVIFGAGQVDRSPCGTGTCAKMALLHSKGQLSCGQPYRQQGILGTEFTGTLIKETTFGSMPAVIPEVTGQAFVTGFHQFVAQPDDPLGFGFQL